MRLRRAPVIGLVVGVTLAVTFTLLPSGGGQHYSAILNNAVKAAGKLVGGGRASAGSTMQAAALSPPYGEITFFAGREIGVSIDPPDGPINQKTAYGCIKIVTPSVTDRGCSKVQPFIPAGNVFLPGYATVHFSVPSWTYPGTRLQAVVELVAKGLPTIVPTFDYVFEPDEQDFFINPALSFQWKAFAAGTLSSDTLGGFILKGNGTLSQSIGVEAENCDGDCIEEDL